MIFQSTCGSDALSWGCDCSANLLMFEDRDHVVLMNDRSLPTLHPNKVVLSHSISLKGYPIVIKIQLVRLFGLVWNCSGDVQYEPKKICRRAAKCGRPLRATYRCLPTPSSKGGERQSPVIFTPPAVLDPMLQTMMDPGTSLPVIPLHESQVTTARLTGGNSFSKLAHVCIVHIVHRQY